MPDVLEPPVAPTPTPTPSPTMDAFDQTFSDLAPSPEPTPEPAPPAAPERPREPETGKFIKPEPKPEPGKVPEKPVVEPKPEPAKPATEFTPPQVAKPSELKSWANRMGARAEKAEQQLVQVNRRLKELESNPQQTTDVKAITEELATTKKRLEEYEGELKVTRYERSGEYKEKYEKPYQSAVQSAYADVRELLVNEPNPEDPEHPRERQATPNDFDEVYQLPLGPATKLAKAKFGDAYTEVLKHRSAIKGAAKAALEAVEAHKGKAAEYEQAQITQQTMEQQGRTQMYNQALQAINEKYPDLFGEKEGDAKWNEALHKGRSMADLAFSDRKGLTPQQSVILDAQIHARVSAFPGLRQENSTLKEQLAAKDKEIAELRGSGPGKPSAAAPKGSDTPTDMTLDQAFDKFVPA